MTVVETRPGRVAGRVALVTGAARGVGRSIALRLADEGADIVAVDLARAVEGTAYPAAAREDLEETARLVEHRGRRVVAIPADVRDPAALAEVVESACADFGGIDIVAANAGIMGAGLAWEIREADWRRVLDVNLSGVWHTVKAAAPAMIAAGRGGAVVITSSISGLKGTPFVAHYAAAKHGTVGLMRALALELAPHLIRVNTVHPTGIATSMGRIPEIVELMERFPRLAASYGNALPVDRVDPDDVANAVLFLASDEARYVTGAAVPVDAGSLVR